MLFLKLKVLTTPHHENTHLQIHWYNGHIDSMNPLIHWYNGHIVESMNPLTLNQVNTSITWTSRDTDIVLMLCKEW